MRVWVSCIIFWGLYIDADPEKDLEKANHFPADLVIQTYLFLFIFNETFTISFYIGSQ